MAVQVAQGQDLEMQPTINNITHHPQLEKAITSLALTPSK